MATAAKVWIPDKNWRVLPPGTGRRCRMVNGRPQQKCSALAVAELQRARNALYESSLEWWPYCSAHLYGRRLENGTIMVEVAVDKAIPQKGYL